MERTITDEDLDVASAHFVQGFREDGTEVEPDLAVDGLSESLFTRLFSRLTARPRG